MTAYASIPESSTIPAALPVGTALVTAVDADGGLRCVLDGQVVAVTPAMPMHYRAEPGDLLLVIGDADRARYWAIGVVQGRGACRLATAGDLELAAGGTLRLEAAQKIELESPCTRLRGARLELLADSLVTRAIDWLVQIRERLQLRARRRDVAIAEADLTRTGSTTHRSTGTVLIDGEQIHLG
jgi:hypothetical protein